ncbi:sulfite exporter TauE/SafE family protein [Leptospira weilii]|uniref:Cytochrome C biogenesis protein transmembrane region n=2 Tax=Leptospira weilii TaxID=28184 RepID=N1UC86_9LEPT|nr:sulfite exporter TauE/SafE family protein [Leptospira weilii]EMY15554.1 cytochrome C biogenesis protein transmembrane region [Leptospira weilii str. Ecochallenge]EMN92065.1 cytochrome C biogenesis protein transmembrane region [Leptospira weilii str. UI 13098]MCL8267556.1 sulfite exporter TauE/SafE family protein [Leptospira weilii]MDL5244771.1 sulfite exporter TauE/SafE family protein [Leptospira weilii]OMI16560.1 cytochrome C biosynthesis protein [Leptospira weilii serovar Heyan]
MQTELFLTTISAAFLHGITSSIHCLGMCGPFAGTLNLYQKEARFKTNLLYNLGRLLSYSTLGAILGFVGSGLNLAGRNIVSLREFAAVISGIFVIVFGLRLLQNADPERSGVYQKILNKFAAPLIISLKQGKNRSGIPLAFGMITGLLPCSALYPAFSLAFATGDVGYGSVIMSAFFLGTFPALFLFGIGFRKLVLKLPTNAIKFAGVAVIFIGISTIFFRMNHTHAEHKDSNKIEQPSSRNEEHSHHH